MDALFTTESLVALATLTAMEVVLGIDNVVFIAILAGKLPPGQQTRARTVGLALAMLVRLGLLFTISWIMGLTRPLFAVMGHTFCGRDLILLLGGLFLVGKSTHEIYDKLEVQHERRAPPPGGGAFKLVLVQILLLDIVFSLDSVITAVGMAKQVWIMAAAMIIAVGIMLVASGAIAAFVNRHPSMKILALSFLLLIGVMLFAEGLGKHVEKGYIYTAMVFSLVVELLNMRLRKKQKPLVLHHRFEDDGAAQLLLEAADGIKKSA